MHRKSISDGGVFFRSAKASRAMLCILICYLLSNTLLVHASTFLLVNSGDGEIYTRFKEKLTSILEPNDNLSSTDLKNFRKNASSLISKNYSAIITTGIEAGIAISHADIHTPIIMSMLPEESYLALSTSKKIICEPTNCQVIFLDQPINRQLRLIKLAFPNRKRIAVLSSNNSATITQQISLLAGKIGLFVHNTRISGESDLITALNQNLSGSDILMAIPDPLIYNRNTARAVLLATFNQHIPLFAYSRSFVRAGAILGIYSTPEQIAHHVADLLRASNAAKSRQFSYPKYFTVDINRRAAEALNIDIPAADYLKQRLELHEKN